MHRLATGRIKPGDSVEELIAAHPPVEAIRHGRFVTLRYHILPDHLNFTGTKIVAKNGRLISAATWSCTYSDIFFNNFTPDDEAEYDASLNAEYRRRRATRHAAQLAAAGFGATFHPDDVPTAPPESEN